MVAKLLSTMNISRTELETAVGLLTTRVSKSDIYNWEKLRRILRFVYLTLKEKDILG